MTHNLRDIEIESPRLAAIRAAVGPIDTGDRTLNLKRGSEITPKAVEWLWPEWIATGKLAILAGAPGTGKTTVALSLAATLTNQAQWPDGTECNTVGNVIIWSGEDSPDDSLAPRLIAAGCNMERVYFIKGFEEAGKTVAFDPALDIHELNKAVVEIGGASLLIIDPIVSAVAGDMHRANDVRRSLQALADFGAIHGCAVLGITHFAKDSKGKIPSERVLGSQAFSALARIVLVAAKTDDGCSRVLARAKSNIGPDDGGVSYNVELTVIDGGIEATYIVWGDAIEGSACDILREVEEPIASRGVASAGDFLSKLLENGPMSAHQIKEAASAAGYSWATMRRAKDGIGAKSVREGFGKDGMWAWAITPKVLTSAKDAHFPLLSTYGSSEHQCEEPSISIEAAL